MTSNGSYPFLWVDETLYWQYNRSQLCCSPYVQKQLSRIFTGPFAYLDHCPKCNEPKLCPITKKPQQEFHALWHNALTAKKFYHWRWKTWEIICKLLRNSGNLSSYNDFYCGSDYLENVRSENFQDNNIVLMLSINNAQLYAHKTSDCWIYTVGNKSVPMFSMF